MSWTSSRDGAEIWWEEQGQGPELLLVGGWTGITQMWAPTVELLSPRFRCISYDLRGNGRSDKPVTSLDIGVHAEDLVAVAAASDAAGPVIVGHSMGAMIALTAAGRLGARALVATGGFPQGSLLEDLAPFDLRGAIADAMPSVSGRADFFAGSGATREIAMETAKWPTDSLLRNAWAFLDGDVSGVASGLSIPAAVLHGDADIIAPFDPCATTLATLIPGAELVAIPGGNHCAMLQQPDTFASLLVRFLDSLDLSA